MHGDGGAAAGPAGAGRRGAGPPGTPGPGELRRRRLDRDVGPLARRSRRNRGIAGGITVMSPASGRRTRAGENDDQAGRLPPGARRSEPQASRSAVRRPTPMRGADMTPPANGNTRGGQPQKAARVAAYQELTN